MEIALIVAGGSGKRMQSETPKQFIEIAGLPVLMHTIKAFKLYASEIRIIVVVPEKQIKRWRKLIRDFSFTINHTCVKGGETRFQSVKNGLEYVSDADVVAIHDGVRPMVSRKIISASFRVATEKGNAVAAIRLKDSIREILESGENIVTSRNRFRIIQTPQTFQGEIIKKAYEADENQLFTDDASVAEFFGEKIYLIEGDPVNVKITTPEDLVFARSFLKN